MSSSSVQAAQAGPASPQHPALEAWALAALGVACGIYLLNSLPSVLFPSGVLASVLTLLLGMLLGLAGAAAALALGFYRLTHPKAGESHSHAPHQLQPPMSAHLRRLVSSRGSGSTPTAPGPTLPHAIAISGEFSGIVYTVPTSLWPRSETVGNWPPTCDPEQGPFRAWEASVAQGTLVLRPLNPPLAAKPPSPGRDKGSSSRVAGQQGKQPGAAAGKPAAGVGCEAAGSEGAPLVGDAAARPPPTKVGIPLEGCSVELVEDGLRGRSAFIRRAPLLISHPQWNLLEGEPAFYLWADDPASKQQWQHALGWWCQDADKLRAVEAMYDAYCQAMASRSILDYPQQVPPADDASSGSLVAGGEGASQAEGAAGNSKALVLAGAEQKSAKKGWKGWGAGKMQSMRRKVSSKSSGSGSLDGSAQPSPAKPNASGGQRSAAASPAKPAPPDAELQSLESFIDAKWMQSRKVQMPPAIPEAVVRSRGGSRHGSKPTSPRAISRPSAANWGGGEAAQGSSLPGSLGLASMPSLQATHGYATPASSPAEGIGVGGGPRKVDTSPAPLSSAVAAAALPPGSPLDRPGLLWQQLPQQQPQPDPLQQQRQPDAAEKQAVAAAVPAPGQHEGQGPFVLPPGLPQLVSPDYAVNAFITRLAFDLLRRPDFQEHVRARIQRQLSRLQRPDYIQSLEVVGVDCGGTAPTLRNWRALPQPGLAAWPQVLFDMRYQGTFTLTIEAKVDIRDAAAWGRLDQALTRLADGKQRRSGTSSSGASLASSTAPPLPHGASAPTMASSSWDEDGEDSEPLSPESVAGSEDTAQEGSGRGGRGFMSGIRHSAAKKLRQLAENTAAHISRIPLRLSLTFSCLEGTMCAWVPPPPGDRLFYAFVSPPHLELTARPELAGRLLKYSYHIARVSSWIESRMRAAMTKNIVFPGGGDIPLLPLLALDHPNVADSLPSLTQYMEQMAAEAKERRQQEKQQERRQQAKQQQQPQQQQGMPAAGGLAAPQQLVNGSSQLGASHSTAEQDTVSGQPQPCAAPEAVDVGAEPCPAPEAVDLGAEHSPAVEPAAAIDVPCAAADPAAAEATDVAAAGEAAGAEPAETPLAAGPPAAAPDAFAGYQQTRTTALPATAPLAASGPAAVGRRSTGASSGGQHEELVGEPSLSIPATQVPAGADAGALRPRPAAQNGGSEGHLISPRGWDGPQAVGQAEGPLALDLRLQAAERQQFSAANAFDVALAQEGATELPTPKFASQPWQHQQPQQHSLQGSLERQAVPAGPLGEGLAASPSPQQQQQAPRDWAAHASQQPPLQLRLAATRSLDPGFTSSAEHTGFGEAPASALPDYSPVRRTLSARVEGSSSSGSGRGVGESLSRSLEYLRRQSSLQHQQVEEDASAAGGLPTSPNAAVQANSQPSAEPACSPPAAQQPGSPSEGARELGRVRQQGSFKEQAGKLFKQARSNMNAAGKALASQVQQMQQQRAALRSGGTSSPAASPVHSAAQPSFAS